MTVQGSSSVQTLNQERALPLLHEQKASGSCHVNQNCASLTAGQSLLLDFSGVNVKSGLVDKEGCPPTGRGHPD